MQFLIQILQEHFREAHNLVIRFPQIVGVSFEKRGSDRQNVVPDELCEVEAGQICNRIPDELRPDMVKFSAMKPNARKQRIVEEVRPKTSGYTFWTHNNVGQLVYVFRVSGRNSDASQPPNDQRQR